MAAIPIVMITINWGARSESLRQAHSSLNPGKSFLLQNAPLPVELGTLTLAQVAQWDTATPIALKVMPASNSQIARAGMLANTTHVRLDFQLKLTIGSASATCLEFRQLFSVGSGGVLMPSQYSFEDFSYVPSVNGPVRKPGISPNGRRSFLGACPLLTVMTTTVEVNCEFLDVTELWWATWAAKDKWGWYLDLDLGGRQERLRVLAWTSGTAPMLWFVAVSDQAATGAIATPAPARPGADVVFFRPPAGFNSFFYTSDEKGFLDKRHSDTTLFHLARWLLSPLPLAKFTAKKAKSSTGPPAELGLMSLRMQPASHAPSIDPKDPIDRIAQNVKEAFRPVGLEAALGKSKADDIAFLPLGFDGFSGPFVGGGYTALFKKNSLLPVISSARRTLWMRGTIGQRLTATPAFDRQIWLAGHSAANGAMFRSLGNNAVDIDRIISFDATPADKLLIPTGVPNVKNAVKARARLSKTLKVVFVTTPNMWSNKAAYSGIEKQLVATGADVTMLPLNNEWDAYWTHPPTATTNAHLFEVLREWDGLGLADSKRMGTVPGPQWLFWHEWAVHGGHAILASGRVDHIQTFFEDILNLQ